MAVAGHVAVELKAKFVCDRRLKQRLALDELKARDVPTVDMQEIESVIDGVNASLAMRWAQRRA
jgi:hypothetical protein